MTLFQETFRRDPFAMVVACVLVNRTRWSEARATHSELLARWPTADAMAPADPADVEPILRRLGFGERRSANLVALARAWRERPPSRAAHLLTMPGCGRYAHDSWAIFVDGRDDVIPTDAKLLSHVRRVRRRPGWEPFRLLDLFSGIGGFSLGLERSGAFRTVAFCEVDPFARVLLARRWPDVPVFPDVRTLTHDELARDGIGVDAICGGFPCQDVSRLANTTRLGLHGERSGLWREYLRLVRDLRPRYVLVENVSALLGDGIDRVLGDLAEVGYDAEWHCVPASRVGAPHRRDRVWIVACPEGSFREGGIAPWVDLHLRSVVRILADPGEGDGDPRDGEIDRRRAGRNLPDDADPFLAYPIRWPAEPGVDRVDDGFPSKLDRCGALGNAVVPQVVEAIGRAIADVEGMTGRPDLMVDVAVERPRAITFTPKPKPKE